MPDAEDASRHQKLTRRELVFLGVWTLVATAAYFYQIDARSLWLDEVMSLNVAAASWPEMWDFFQTLPEQHPLYYLLLGGWIKLGTHEVALRSLSAVFAVGSGWLSYLLARRLFGRRSAVLTATILLVSPFWLYYAQEARMYTLLGFLGLASHLLFLRWRGDDRWAAWGYVLVGVLGAYTHLFFLFVPLAHLVIAAEKHRGLAPEVAKQAVATAIIGVAYLPWVWLILTHMPEGQEWKGAEHLLFGLPYMLFRFSVGYAEVIPVAGWKQDLVGLATDHGLVIAGVLFTFGALLVIGTVAAARRGRSGRFVLLSTAVPIVAMYALSTVTVLVGERYQILIFPLFVILLALAIEEFVLDGRGKQSLVGGALVLLALMFSVQSLVGYYTNDLSAKAEWRGAAGFVANQAEAGDCVLFYADYTDSPFKYYYSRSDGPGLTVADSLRSLSSVDEDAERLWVLVSHAPQESECAETLKAHIESETSNVALHRNFPSGAGIDVFLIQLGTESASEDALGVADVVRLCSSAGRVSGAGVRDRDSALPQHLARQARSQPPRRLTR